MTVTYSRKGSRKQVVAPGPSSSLVAFGETSDEELPPNTSCWSSPRPKAIKKTRKRKHGRRYIQMYLDVGQRNGGRRKCELCGLVYNGGVKEDERTHGRFCGGGKGRAGGGGHGGAYMERILATRRFGRCETVRRHEVRVEKGTRKSATERSVRGKDTVQAWVLKVNGRQARRKIEDLEEYLSEKLGSCDMGRNSGEASVFVHITEGRKTIDGILFVDRITEACIAKVTDDLIVVKRSEDKVPAFFGVKKIWVAEDARRRGIASELLDAARENLTYGYIIPTDQVAFTAPTAAGAQLALSYTKHCGRNILVYGGETRSKTEHDWVS